MGCDIHLYGEVKRRRWIFGRKRWESFDEWEIVDDRLDVPYNKRIYTGGRNYNLFAALCGVRSYAFHGEPPRISEPKGIPKGVNKEYISIVDDWGSDGHSHNWNTLEELKQFNWSSYGETCNRFLDEVLPKLEATGANPSDVRILYFFDN